MLLVVSAVALANPLVPNWIKDFLAAAVIAFVAAALV